MCMCVIIQCIVHIIAYGYTNKLLYAKYEISLLLILSMMLFIPSNTNYI